VDGRWVSGVGCRVATSLRGASGKEWTNQGGLRSSSARVSGSDRFDDPTVDFVPYHAKMEQTSMRQGRDVWTRLDLGHTHLLRADRSERGTYPRFESGPLVSFGLWRRRDINERLSSSLSPCRRGRFSWAQERHIISPPRYPTLVIALSQPTYLSWRLDKDEREYRKGRVRPR
jgi:hypothetical protein